ncbi:PREDICTED: NUT family member 2F [Ceratotherium simum simum]|uniref:NUT family member 2F n=1 Tax=Ceratotherium simum simum TaxID=73337 RepID=A0ABM1DL03_CERSS|nr:PREDICTED: NUT family member 2F [Ceratotherium simum simum]
MASEEASPALGPDVTVNPGASMSPFSALPFPPPTPGPPHRPPWQQHPPPLMTPSFPPDSPLVLPAFPRTPLVAASGHSPGGTGACNVIVQVRSEGRPEEPPQTQNFVLTQAPLNWSAAGALCGNAAYSAPLFLAASMVETTMPTPAVGATPAGKGGWSPGLPPQAPPPAAQLASIFTPVNAGPQPHGASREGGLATTPSKASLGDSCNAKSVYENFRRWQHFKSLAWRHLPQSPDTEALSCFLIPVLRSLARLKPAMTLEEGLWRAVQEWQRKSNFDRMIFYEMAGKFMEFEVEEEMQIQKLQWMKGVHGVPPPAPPRPDPRGPPAPEVGPQPAASACVPRKAGPRAQPARPQPHRPLRRLESRAPKEIPSEAVREYMDIMEGMVGPARSAVREPAGGWKEDGNEPQQEEGGTYPDPGLLSYIDKLCSQEDFITKVEAVLHPRFLAELLSPEPQLDPLALAEELEQEEGLTPEQLVQKRLLALEEEGSVPAPPSHSAPSLDSSPESEAGQGAHDHGPQLGVSDEACPPETDCDDPQRHGQANTDLSRPEALALSPGRQESPPLWAGRPPSPHQAPRCTPPRLGPRDASILGEASPAREKHGPADGSSEDEDDLPSLAFLLASQHSLLPWRLSQSPAPASGLLCPAGQGACGAPQAPSPQRLGLSPAPPPAAKSWKRPVRGGPAPAEKTPLPGANLGVSGRPALALGLVRPSQPQKRRCDPFVTGRRRKRHCSQ